METNIGTTRTEDGDQWTETDLLGNPEKMRVEQQIDETIKSGYYQEKLSMHWIGKEFFRSKDECGEHFYKVLDQSSQVMEKLKPESVEKEISRTLRGRAASWAANVHDAEWSPTPTQVKSLYRTFLLVCEELQQVPGFLPRWESGYTLHRYQHEPCEMATPYFDSFEKRISDSGFWLAHVWGVYSKQYKGRQCPYIFGDAETGKSKTVGTIIDELFGFNKGAGTMEVSERAIERQFILAAAWGKSVLYISECHNPDWPKSRVYKQISSGDIAEIEFKFRSSFSGRVDAAIFTLSNRPPALPQDRSILSRTVPISIENYEGEPASDYEQQIRKEIPGILYKAREAWGRLARNDGYRIEISDRTMELTQSLVSSSTLKYSNFTESIIEFDEGSYIKSGHLMKVFETYFQGTENKGRYNEYQPELVKSHGLRTTTVKGTPRIYGVRFKPSVLVRECVENFTISRKVVQLFEDDLNATDPVDEHREVSK